MQKGAFCRFFAAFVILWTVLESCHAGSYSIARRKEEIGENSSGVEDNMLLITSTEGRIFAYAPKLQKVLWAANLEISLVGSSHRLEFMDDEQPYLVPTIDGDLAIFSNNAQVFNRYPKDILTSALQYCPLKKNSRVFTTTEEHAFILNIQNGLLLPLSRGNLGDFDNEGFNAENSIVIKVKQFTVSAMDFAKMKDLWSVNSAEVEVLQLEEFFGHRPEIPSPEGEHSRYFFLRKEQNVMEIYEKKDWELVSNLQTEDKIFRIFAKNITNAKFYPVQIKGKLDFVVNSHLPIFSRGSEIQALPWDRIEGSEDDTTALAVFSDNSPNGPLCRSGDSSCLEDAHFKIVKKTELETLIDCVEQNIRDRRDQMIDEIDRSRIAIADNNDDEDDDDEEEDDDSSSNKAQSTVNITEITNQHESSTTHYAFLIALSFSIAAIAIVVLAKRKSSIKAEAKSGPSKESDSVKETSESNEGVRTYTAIKNDKKIVKKILKSNKIDKSMSDIKVDINESEILGYGSAGTVVYGGTFQSRQVAVKRVLKSHNVLASKEIEILLKVDHPCILKYLFYQEDKEFIYLVLERCVFSIGDLIEFWEKIDKKAGRKESKAQRKQISPTLFAAFGDPTMRGATKMRIIIDCLNAIEYLHKNNVIHRDIKPDNALVTIEGRVKISDFAISKILDDTRENFLTENVGTAGWKAPEVLLHAEKTKAVDIFALGCLIYFIHTDGEHPFGQRYERDQRIINNDVKFNIPYEDYEIQDLIAKMVCHNPKERPTIEQVRDHPVFWTVEKKLNYMQEFSNFIESRDEKIGIEFDEKARADNVIPPSWDRVLESAILKDVMSFRKYDFTSTRNLIRVIRNKKSHFYELSIDSRLLIGSTPLAVYEYFAKKFPKLFLSIYYFCVDNNISLV